MLTPVLQPTHRVRLQQVQGETVTEPSPVSASSVLVDHAVVGVSDMAASTAFFEAFGFEVVAQNHLEAAVAQALYGLDAETDEVVLGVSGADTGRLRLVTTPLPLPERGHFHRGGHALDIYTTDMAASTAIARDLGVVVGPTADYVFGPVSLQQAQAMAPDEVPFVFVGIDRRLPSVLDEQPDRLHSELHSVVGCVDGIDAETVFWKDIVGLELRSQFPIDVPAVSEFMMLPRHVPIRMSVMSGSTANPPRFELLEFSDAEGLSISGRPLLPGCLVVGLRVADVDAAVASMAAAGATVYPAVEAPGLQGGTDRAAFVTTPGGIDLEVRGPLS